MNHQEAVAAQAAERYLLHELSAPEVDDFELHYFECPECARAVEAGMQFIEGTRAVFSEEGREEAREPTVRAAREPFWLRWLDAWRQPSFVFAASVAVVMGGVALYQGAVVIPGVRRMAAQAQPAVSLPLMAASRGEVEETAVPSGASSLVLSAVLPPDAHFAQYRWELASGGRTIAQATVPAPKSGGPLLISAPVGGLRTAAYELTIYGLAATNQIGDKIDIYPFRLRFP